MERSTTITVNGLEYEAELATISSAFIGFQDHGIFTAYLTFRGGAWGQAEPGRAWSPEGFKLYITAVLKTLDINSWDKVEGEKVFVLRDGHFGDIKGFTHLTEDRSVIFSEIAQLQTA